MFCLSAPSGFAYFLREAEEPTATLDDGAVIFHPAYLLFRTEEATAAPIDITGRIHPAHPAHLLFGTEEATAAPIDITGRIHPAYSIP